MAAACVNGRDQDGRAPDRPRPAATMVRRELPAAIAARARAGLPPGRDMVRDVLQRGRGVDPERAPQLAGKQRPRALIELPLSGREF